MDKSTVIEGVNRKNTAAIEQALKEMIFKIEEQDKKITTMHTTLVSMSERMTSLENQIIIFKTRNIGTGPSVRE